MITKTLRAVAFLCLTFAGTAAFAQAPSLSAVAAMTAAERGALPVDQQRAVANAAVDALRAARDAAAQSATTTADQRRVTTLSNALRAATTAANLMGSGNDAAIDAAFESAMTAYASGMAALNGNQRQRRVLDENLQGVGDNPAAIDNEATPST